MTWSIVANMVGWNRQGVQSKESNPVRVLVVNMSMVTAAARLQLGTESRCGCSGNIGCDICPASALRIVRVEVYLQHQLRDGLTTVWQHETCTLSLGGLAAYTTMRMSMMLSTATLGRCRDKHSLCPPCVCRLCAQGTRPQEMHRSRAPE